MTTDHSLLSKRFQGPVQSSSERETDSRDPLRGPYGGSFWGTGLGPTSPPRTTWDRTSVGTVIGTGEIRLSAGDVTHLSHGSVTLDTRREGVGEGPLPSLPVRRTEGSLNHPSSPLLSLVRHTRVGPLGTSPPMHYPPDTRLTTPTCVSRETSTTGLSPLTYRLWTLTVRDLWVPNPSHPVL